MRNNLHELSRLTDFIAHIPDPYTVCPILPLLLSGEEPGMMNLSLTDEASVASVKCNVLSPKKIE